jgi:hypothetical protein
MGGCGFSSNPTPRNIWEDMEKYDRAELKK